MFYRRKHYVVKNEFVKTFNAHFNETNLPNQIKHGARLIGRWMTPIDDAATEVFAIWEYDSYESYKQSEINIRTDREHLIRINNWYDMHGGRDYVLQHYIISMKNDQLFSTINEQHMSMNDIQFWQKH